MSDQGGPRPDRGGPSRHVHRRRRRSRYSVPVPPFRWVALVVVGFVLAGAGGTLSFFWPSITAAVAATGHTITVPPRTPSPAPGASSSPSAAPVPGGAFTVLLMGSDNDSKFTSNGVPVFCCAQSLILMRVDPAAGAVTMLSLPRDLWVPLYNGRGAFAHDGKVDQAFGSVGGDGTNGANAEIATIEQDFQVHIDHYVWIGLQGLINLINDVGGINIVASHPVLDDNYPYDVGNSTNPFAADRVAVLPGAQHMNGYQAMEYVRSRHDDLSEDLGRTVRQQQVLVALRQRLVGLSVGDVNQIASALQGEVLTDVPLTQIPTLLGIVKDVGAGNITHVFLSTSQFSNATVGGQSVLQPDMPSILQTVHQYFPAA